MTFGLTGVTFNLTRLIFRLTGVIFNVTRVTIRLTGVQTFTAITPTINPYSLLYKLVSRLALSNLNIYT